MGSHLRMLLENEERLDVTFCVAGKRFDAHKHVLAAFQTESFNGMKEDGGGLNTIY